MRVGNLVEQFSMFGMGMGTIYTGALYYAMEVRQMEVEAGRKYEALIVHTGCARFAGLELKR